MAAKPTQDRRITRRDIASPPGIASAYLRYFADLVAKGVVEDVVLYCRVSGRTQRRKANAADQEAGLRRALAALDLPVLNCCIDNGVSGWRFDEQQGLSAAIEAARSSGPRTIVLAESTGRYRRHKDYDGTKTEVPTVADFEDLMRRANGVLLATLLQPDAPFEEVRQFETVRGQREKQNQGGRPRNPPPAPPPEPKPQPEANYHEFYAIDKLTWALRLGMTSKKEIARFYDRPRSTVRGWVKHWELRWGIRWPGGGEN
jgi:DNA invertase Pin-like site-specific DNA recombinase